MLERIFRRSMTFDGVFTSRLFDNDTFYPAFEKDLYYCRSEAVIESPFITLRRVDHLLPVLQKAIRRGVRVTVNTKPLDEHDEYMRLEAESGIAQLQGIGVNILFTGGHHRKFATFDRKILWEGSLNILSQNDSCEIMRRIESNILTEQMLRFTRMTSYP